MKDGATAVEDLEMLALLGKGIGAASSHQFWPNAGLFNLDKLNILLLGQLVLGQILGILKLDRMVSPTLGLGPHNLGNQCYLNLGVQKMLGLQVYHQKAQRMGWTKNNKKDDPMRILR